MCFSSTASFAAGAVLFTAGIATVKEAASSKQILLASIPLVFSAQQITEGFLWLSLSHSSVAESQLFTTYAYITFAQIVWPLILPLALLIIEGPGWRRNTILALSILGILVAIFRTYSLAKFGVSATVIDGHISYVLNTRKSYTNYGLALYFATTAAPLLVSSIKRVWILGVLIVASYIATFFFYRESVLSIWCFFAGLISIGLFLILRDVNISRNMAKVNAS